MGLAALAGLPAGATVLGVSFAARNGLFRARPRPWAPAPWMGAFLVGHTVAMLPAMLSGPFLREMSWATAATLQLLVLLTGFAALMFGYIVRMLEEPSAAENGGDPRRTAADPGGADPAAGGVGIG